MQRGRRRIAAPRDRNQHDRDPGSDGSASRVRRRRRLVCDAPISAPTVASAKSLIAARQSPRGAATVLAEPDSGTRSGEEHAQPSRRRPDSCGGERAVRDNEALQPTSGPDVASIRSTPARAIAQHETDDPRRETVPDHTGRTQLWAGSSNTGRALVPGSKTRRNGVRVDEERRPWMCGAQSGKCRTQSGGLGACPPNVTHVARRASHGSGVPFASVAPRAAPGASREATRRRSRVNVDRPLVAASPPQVEEDRPTRHAALGPMSTRCHAAAGVRRPGEHRDKRDGKEEVQECCHDNFLSGRSLREDARDRARSSLPAVSSLPLRGDRPGIDAGQENPEPTGRTGVRRDAPALCENRCC